MTGLQKGIVAGVIGLIFVALVAVGLYTRSHQPPASKKPRLATPQAIAAAEARLPDTPVGAGERYGLDVVREAPGALDKLRALAQSEDASFKSNSVKMSDEQKGELARTTFTPLHVAFEVITMAATNRNQAALTAVAKSLRVPELRGMAAHSLGVLAAAGDEKALAVLLNPAKYGLLLADSVGSLKPVAERGNQKAIDFLTAVTRERKDYPLWYLAADGLRPAAGAGNKTAINALVPFLKNTNNILRLEATYALRQAASNHVSGAAQALNAAGVSAK